MDILLKQRLVGAIVLISLAVIFIPMLLSGNADILKAQFKSNIPPLPSYEISRPVIAEFEQPNRTDFLISDRESAADNKPATDQQTTPASDTPMADVASTENANVEMGKQNAPVNNDTVPQSSAQVQANANLQSSDSKAPATAPTKQPAAGTATITAKSDVPPATSWIVQVGSFSKKNNAITLQNKIRKAGLSSFVNEVNSKAGIVYRVRVGPELDRSLADNLRKKLHKNFGLDGLVMRYP